MSRRDVLEILALSGVNGVLGAVALQFHIAAFVMVLAWAGISGWKLADYQIRRSA